MGLDTSHDAWHGAYSSFMTWRKEVAKVAGLPPLTLMEGFYAELDIYELTEIRKQLPIKWSCLKPMALHELLYHSDCEGHINWRACKAIADDLEKLLPLLSDSEVGGHIGNYKYKTGTFIAGLRLAYERNENLIFR